MDKNNIMPISTSDIQPLPATTISLLKTLENRPDFAKASSPDLSNNAIDINFAVPQSQRQRFTKNVFVQDKGTLLDLLVPSGAPQCKVQVWVDSNVADASPDKIMQLEKMLDEAEHVDLTMPAQHMTGGEACKLDPAQVERLLKSFNDANLDRRSYIIVIGGGAVLDVVGFAAATAHRGIRLIRLPSTTLGQSDSGVGVKNAVNYFDKKNWLGSFATPWAVINDASLLDGLPDRDFASGFSEAVKVTLLKSEDGFNQLCKDAKAIAAREPEAVERALRVSVLLHLLHITHGGDPFEVREARPLDFGHWSAHKLEALTQYELRHGDAVAIGVAIDCLYSVHAHGLPEARAYDVLECLQNLGLPLFHPVLENPQPIFEGLEEFRQHLGGRLTVTMLRDVGDPVDVHEIDKELVAQAIESLRDFTMRSEAPAPVSKPALVSAV